MIPFNTSDEGVDFIFQARRAVKEATVPELDGVEVYIVMFAYVLGGWKALLSTPLPDGKYYEVTYNKDKKEAYVDTYLKIDNKVIAKELLS